MASNCKESCSPTVLCCQMGFPCFFNITACSEIKCNRGLCPRNCCYKGEYCMGKFQCFLQNNLVYTYIILGVIFAIFLLAVYNYYKTQKKNGFLREKPRIKQNPFSITKNSAKKKLHEKDSKKKILLQEENVKHTEILPTTERQDLINAIMTENENIEFEEIPKFKDKKDINKYIIKNQGSNNLHINLKAVSQNAVGTFGKIIGLRRMNTDSKRMKSIHTELPFSRMYESSPSHPKFFSLEKEIHTP